ncbi:hypothetical protein AURDEDRAFT_130798 [Auricularia subglabra TFB-10046 SS5]|uniref:Uncharacterized protein n=1 Tax=Auricularia subglabra (strain TFB-10046 / SS5) TaxID=717982 RepID=J0CWQ7_AURST|nr:hypothetical protein AURDEDRAFT_130798 [Auricularia subglabra TFB-10046 SS5]
MLLLLVSLARARLVNVTIDDTFGDARSGLVPRYTPQDYWGNSTGAHDRVNGTALARSSHWTIDNNIQCNISVLFYGTRIYTFMDIQVYDGMELSFFLDDEVHVPAKTYTRAEDSVTPHFERNVLVFESDPLPLDRHELTVFAAKHQHRPWYFDYAVYTTEDGGPGLTSGNAASSAPHQSQSPALQTTSRGKTSRGSQLAPTPSADPRAGRTGRQDNTSNVRIGASVGSVALLLLAACCALSVWKRRQRRQTDGRARGVTPYAARQQLLPVGESPDKLARWVDAQKAATDAQAPNDLPERNGLAGDSDAAKHC